MTIFFNMGDGLSMWQKLDGQWQSCHWCQFYATHRFSAMSAIIILLSLATLAISAIATALHAVARDGYGRVPNRRPLREYERDEHYRA